MDKFLVFQVDFALQGMPTSQNGRSSASGQVAISRVVVGLPVYILFYSLISKEKLFLRKSGQSGKNLEATPFCGASLGGSTYSGTSK